MNNSLDVNTNGKEKAVADQMSKYFVGEYFDHVDDYELECRSQSEVDIPFWRELIERYMPARVLELACGSGRIGVELLRGPATFHLEGLEINENMLAAYSRKMEHEPEELKQRLTLHRGDMYNYELENKGKFGLIFLPFNGICHLYTVEQQLETFRNTYEHLAPGGRFVIDVYVPRNCSGDTLPLVYLDNVIETPDGKLKMLIYSSHSYDRYEQIDHITWVHEKFFASGVHERYLTRLDYRAFFPLELQMLFQVTGFTIEASYGDYSWIPFGQGTRQIVIGYKRDERDASDRVL